MKHNFLGKKTALADTKVALARACGLLLALALAVGLALPAMAVPIPEHAFYGDVFVSNATGNPPVPEGTPVTAEIDGVEYVAATVDALGQYGYPKFSFNVPGDDLGTGQKEGGVNGDIIDFYVHGSKIWVADFVFDSGNHTELDLPIVDNIPPVVTLVTMPPACTGDETPTFTGTATDSWCAIQSVEYKVNGGVWTAAAATDGTFDSISEGYTFTTGALGEGTYTVDVRATDIADNTVDVAGYASYTFTVDLADPTGTIIINDNATCTNDANVNLALTYSDGAGCGVVSMHFSNDGTTWSAWEDAATTKAWVLSTGDGLKTVWVEFLDAGDNNSNSEGAITDTIMLDTADPTGTIIINGGATSTDDANVNLALTYSDGAGCGVVSMHFSNDGTTWSAWEDAATTKAWVLSTGDGLKTVWVEFLDAGDNNSNSEGAITDTIMLSTSAVLINEFVSDPGATQVVEWIELYNIGDTAIDLTDWTIEDGTGIPDDLTGFTIPANDYLVLIGGGAAFNFTLSDAADTIILTDNSAAEMDRVAYGTWDDGNTADNAPAPGEDESTGRCPNGVDTDVDNVDFRVFTTPTPDEANTSGPAVSTAAATVITDTSATLNGNLDDAGCPAGVEVWFEWGTTSGALGNETTHQVMATTGSFSNGIGPLASNTTYYYRAVADGGTVYGDEMSFKTLPGPPLMTIDLDPGWNILSTPINLDSDLDEWGELKAQAGLDCGVSWSYQYAGDTGYWSVVTGSYVLSACDAIYVYMNDSGSVPIYPNTGTTVSSKDVNAGWNLVGSAFITGTGEYPVDDALISLFYASGELLPWGYSQVVSPELNQPGWIYAREGTVQNMLEGKGYWVAMDNADEYLGQTFTPWVIP